MKFRSHVMNSIAPLCVAPEGGDPSGGGAGGGGAPGAGAPPAGAGAPAAGAGAAAPAFADTLPEDIRSDAVFKDIKDVAGLAKSYHAAAKMVGMDKGSIVAIPKADADPKAWDDFYNKAGRPESADKYAVPKRGDGKPYADADVALQKQILPVLHKAGLTQRQIDAIVPAWNDIVGAEATTAAATSAKAMEDAGKALKAEWGAAYEPNMKLAQTALQHYSGQLKLGDQILAELDQTKLGNSPAIAKLLVHLGGQLKEDGALEGKADGGAGGVLAPTEAKQQIDAMEKDQEKAKILTNKSHPKHKELVAERTRLYEMAYPPEPAAA